MDELVIAGRVFKSRLFLGSARFPDTSTFLEAVDESETEMVTVSMRRVHSVDSSLGNVFQKQLHILPNTAGCYTAKEAVLTAKLAREALGTEWIKLEIFGDDQTLYPDVCELLKASEELINEGFKVLPYCNDDPVTCRKLADMGSAAIMPLGSPIGSGMGILNPYNFRMIREKVQIPLIIDAGLGCPSDVAYAMELGADAVLVDSAIAEAEDPIPMARGMKYACIAGRLAYLSGCIPQKTFANPTSPKEGVVVL